MGLGRQLRVCPYYATRDLMDQAQIIFSPYNYLIDPKVRQSMKIPINDNVIILDEAHNIEDCARESAGGTFSQEDFRLALNDCEKVEHHEDPCVFSMIFLNFCITDRRSPSNDGQGNRNAGSVRRLHDAVDRSAGDEDEERRHRPRGQRYERHRIRRCTQRGRLRAR